MKLIKLDRANQKLKLLIAAKPGSGKTTLLGSASLDDRAYPVLHIDAGGNPESLDLQDNKGKSLYDLSKITVIRMTELKDLSLIYDYLYTGQKADHQFARSLGDNLLGTYKTLTFDGITDVQRLIIDNVAGNTNAAPGSKLNPVQIQHYNEILNQMVRFAKLFYGLNLHIIITSLEQDLYENDTFRGYVPALQGKSANEVPGYALGVYRLTHTGSLSSIQRKVDNIPDNAITYMYMQRSPLMPMIKDQHQLKLPGLANPQIKMLLDRLYAPKE